VYTVRALLNVSDDDETIDRLWGQHLASPVRLIIWSHLLPCVIPTGDHLALRCVERSAWLRESLGKLESRKSVG